MPSLTITGSLCRLWVNNKIWSPVQSVSIESDSGIYPIFGINSPDAQELADGQRSIRGNIKAIRTKQSGGLQGVNLLPLFSDIAAGNYVSLRLEDRSTSETLWSIPKCRIGRVNESTQAKGIYVVNVEFTGQLLFWPLDLS